MSKYVYFFGAGKADGRADMKNLLGGKGANLAEMVNIGLPVPAGFTLTTEVCIYYGTHKKYPDGLAAEVDAAMRKTEEVMGAKFGDPKNPLLVSCRSGARVSMPGRTRRSEEHTSELQSPMYLVCRLLLENKKQRVRVDPPRAERQR